jgi:hypothetical protein
MAARARQVWMIVRSMVLVFVRIRQTEGRVVLLRCA